MIFNNIIIFTICSNNYLAQANVLGKSIKKQNPEYKFQIFLCDKKSPNINYKIIDFEVVEISSIEFAINSLAERYNIIELNTAVKPTVFEYLFNQKQIDKAIYLDPDICLYHSLQGIERELSYNSILLTPHIKTPIPLDNKMPNENLFLNYGTYNLGFLGLKRDDNSLKFLRWWKAHTYENGYISPAKGVFVDQLPMNLTPIFFDGVKVLTHLGYNMAPWNLHERFLVKDNGIYMVNGHQKLIFYHFSSFVPNKNSFPLGLDRFKLEDRTDLQELYEKYYEAIIAADYFMFSKIKSFYSLIFEKTTIAKQKIEWQQISLLKKIIFYLKKLFL